ncbi:MAG: Mov34/MPN/PAD-1 family protein [Euryarchaeota archaeon]|nr:Mov34/MPN/PAD-1 family protein [Euryarchaeota archaeon]
MIVKGIREELLDLLIRLGESTHPREFLVILKERDGIIEELDLVPGTISRPSSASFSPAMLPLDLHKAGSAHSHPTGPLRPSDADLRYFSSMGPYHIIIGPPYTRADWRCFTAKGEPCELEVIP